MPLSYGTRSSIMHGNQLNLGILFWDTIIRESVPDCYADLGLQLYQQIRAEKFHYVRMTVAGYWPLNLYSYVNNPFTKKAEFDFELFKEHVGLAQRMMDDIIDLELEKIDAILAKIDADPESEELKSS